MNKKNQISAIVLTFQEELHIARCIKSLLRVCSEIFIVDSFSTDKTCETAKSLGAHVVQHEYINQAQQFQWALDTLPCKGDWVMRLDADEYLTEELINELQEELPKLNHEYTGCYILRDIVFLGKNLQHGRLKPPAILRLWRNGAVYMEQRWMDERCVLKYGKAVTLTNRFVDHNLNGLTWWTQKHNNYASRELAVEIGSRYGLFEDNGSNHLQQRNNQKKRYYKLPPFLRAFAYFFVRYILLGGFLDGKPGLIWATLQAYWYRFLIDAKMYELETVLGKNPEKEQLREYFKKNSGLKI